MSKYLPLYLIVASILLFSCNGCKPQVKQDTDTNTNTSTGPDMSAVKVPTFDGDTAYSFVAKQVAFGPRVNNTKAHIECGDWMIAELKKYSDTVIVQSCKLTGFDGKILQSRNIIASINPKAVHRIMLSTHWDTRPFADQDTANKKSPIDGANDGASGVGILIEVLRACKTMKLDLGVDVVMFDAEDYGSPADQEYVEDSYCLGSQYWSKHPHVPGYRADFGILLDMVGAPNATFTKEGTSMMFATSYVNYVWNIANEVGYGNYFRYDQTGGLIDDHKYVNEITGIPTIDIIHRTADTHSGFGAYWHTHQDGIKAVDKNTLKAVGQVLMYTIYRYNAHPEVLQVTQ